MRCRINPGEVMRIRAVACIEPSQLVDSGESGGDIASSRGEIHVRSILLGIKFPAINQQCECRN